VAVPAEAAAVAAVSASGPGGDATVTLDGPPPAAADSPEPTRVDQPGAGHAAVTVAPPHALPGQSPARAEAGHDQVAEAPAATSPRPAARKRRATIAASAPWSC